MQKKIQISFFVTVFLFAFGNLNAFSIPPVNDSTCSATDLGALPSPGLCPNTPEGDTISFLGTTQFATYNPYDFPVTHCFANGSPDVWYKLRATGSYLYVEMVGYSGLNNFFIKLHHSQGSCLSLVPMHCVTSFANTITYSFQTPVVNGEYYLQIGGDSPSTSGDFYLKMKCFNDCNGCVKHGNVVLNPAPTFGRYNTGDTVTMCTTVSRWESLSTSYLHGIVPEFGPDWDITTLQPILQPATASSSTANFWHWFTNVPTPNGPLSGYFFDGDSDGNPSNNPGDQGGILTNWIGCWKIASITPCNTNDLSIDVHLFSDAETGNGNPNFICSPFDVIHISTASNCCPSPFVQVNQTVGCTPGTGSVVVTGNSLATDTFNYILVDTSMNALQSYLNMVGGVVFTNLFPGQYYVIAENISNGGCFGFETITINEGVALNIQQTNVGCLSGQSEAIVSVLNGSGVYSYNWINVNTANQWDSIAYFLPDGWVSVTVTDAVLGCTVLDSINIFSIGMPDATYDLPDSPSCTNADSILVNAGPISPGGNFTLIAPLTGGITVNGVTGTIYLNNTTLNPPFYIYVKYSVGTLCQSFFVDSVLIVAVPAVPIPTSQATMDYCIGGPSPVLTVTVPANMVAGWYDVQTTGTALGNSFTTPLNGSTIPGTYFYTVVSIFTISGGCTSLPAFFSISAVPSPIIVTSNDTTICKGQIANVDVNGCTNCTYVWGPTPTLGSPFAQSFQTSPNSSTSYTVVATNTAGCTAIEYCDVTVDESGSCFLNIYHGLTPNQDGHNDTWVVDGITSLVDPYVIIYNRWGQRVWNGFQYDNTNIVFKGNDSNENPLPDGTYFFIIQSTSEPITGWIELSH